MKRFALLAAFLCAAAHAAAQGTCPDGKPIDGVNRAGTPKACLVAIPYQPKAVAVPNLLVVYLHGDNGSRITWEPLGSGAPQRIADGVGAPTIALQRPGYRSEQGSSDGQSGFQDDDYTGANVEIIAGALASLRAAHPDRKILLLGFSGGAAMTALTAARFPSSADGYVLAGCPCDIGRWREWRNASAGRSGTWSRSLSPVDEASKVPRDLPLLVTVGSKDDNTLPKFSEAFVAALGRGQAAPPVVLVPEATHGTILRSPDFFAAAREFAQRIAGGAAKPQQ